MACSAIRPTAARAARAIGITAAATLLVAAGASTRAQDLEPRAYSPSPVGTNFFAVSLSSMSGAILFDPTLPITDVHADIGMVTAGYGRTFAVAGHQSLLAIAVPYAVANLDGKVSEVSRSIYRSGLGDLRLKASLPIIGGKAMTPAEFARAPHTTIFGVSLTVQAPTGQYDATKLINIGTNRWAFKPELGVSVPVGRWSLEAYGAVCFFLDNDAFYPGHSVKRQALMTSLQGHVSYTFKNRAWLALDGTWYGGGEVTVDSGPPSTRTSNVRAGATFSLPLAKQNSLKFALSRGTYTRTGGDFDTYIVAWQHVWFSQP